MKLWGAAGGLLLAAAWSSVALAQQATAAEAVDRFLALNSSEQLQSDEGRALRTAEASRWESPTVAPLPDRHDRLMAAGPAEAVARVAGRTPKGDPIDLYFYLDGAEDGWRVSRMRALALPPFIYELRDQLQAKPSRTSEEEGTLAHLRLLTRTDAELHNWFGDKRSEIDALVEAYERLPAGSRGVGDQDDAAPEVSAALRALHLERIFTEDDRIVLLIGGIVDNSVGLMRTSTPPTISPSEYIWIEPLADGWFLFKTT